MSSSTTTLKTNQRQRSERKQNMFQKRIKRNVSNSVVIKSEDSVSICEVMRNKIRRIHKGMRTSVENIWEKIQRRFLDIVFELKNSRFIKVIADEQGDVPGWVLVVLMTTGLVTAIWAIAAPRLSEILKHSLDSMNSIG
jgi:hypothetical protein